MEEEEKEEKLRLCFRFLLCLSFSLIWQQYQNTKERVSELWLDTHFSPTPPVAYHSCMQLRTFGVRKLRFWFQAFTTSTDCRCLLPCPAEKEERDRVSEWVSERAGWVAPSLLFLSPCFFRHILIDMFWPQTWRGEKAKRKRKREPENFFPSPLSPSSPVIRFLLTLKLLQVCFSCCCSCFMLLKRHNIDWRICA